MLPPRKMHFNWGFYVGVGFFCNNTIMSTCCNSLVFLHKHCLCGVDKSLLYSVLILVPSVLEIMKIVFIWYVV